MLRWLVYIVSGLLVLLLVCGTTAYLLLGHLNLASLAAHRASAALGRTVTIAELHVTPGRWITVDAVNARLGNVADGSRPAMVELGHLTAEINAMSLLHRPVMIRRLTVNRLSILLERTPDRTPNWTFGAAKPKPQAPRTRAWFPTLLDARLNDSDITYRTSKGVDRRTKLDGVRILTLAANQPVQLTATGAYNGTPVSLAAELQPIAVLRDANVPYGVDFRLRSDETTLTFKGTMTEPLDVDGAKGVLVLDAPTAKSLLAVAGLADTPNLSLRLAGKLERTGDVWSLNDATGALKDNSITAASLRLQEGVKGKPDDIAINIAFERLNLNGLLRGGGTGGQSGADISLAIVRSPDPLIEARLSTRQLIYNGVSGTDASVAAAVVPGQIAVKALALTYLGAQIRADGRIEAADKGGRVSANLVVSGAEVQQLRQLLGFGAVPLAGKLDAQLVAVSSGATLNAAARSANVSAAVSMNGGSIARQVIEMASTDVRLLFRKAKGMTPVSCVLGVLNMQAGVGIISPLRVRAAEGTIVGYARFNLYRRMFDLTIGSQPTSTGVFALDIPVRVSGSFGNPTVRPARWSAAVRARLATGLPTSQVPQTLQQLVQRNPCINGREPARSNR